MWNIASTPESSLLPLQTLSPSHHRRSHDSVFCVVFSRLVLSILELVYVSGITLYALI